MRQLVRPDKIQLIYIFFRSFYYMVYSRIRDLREDRDLKQQDLADYLNCSQVCYSRYENGQRDIPLETISKIADFYNVSVDYLLNRTDCPDMISD